MCFLLTLTQEEVFKSISDNVGQGGGSDLSGRTFFAILLGVAGVIMLISLFNLRRKREAVPKAVNHPGRLLKEVMKQIPLKPVELKQLRLLAEAENDAGAPLQSPLTFLLCPSAFAAAMRAGRVKVDRKVMAGLAKKMGLVTKADKNVKRQA